MNPQQNTQLPTIALSSGIFQSNSELPEGSPFPEAIVQVLNIKKVPSGNGQPGMERFSYDASQLNELVSSGSITKFGYLKLQKYICNTVVI
ncbi:hypothetical protein BASA81_017402 [Batrachochytrium salamandrivorans]|nr:hypothetical protein BASA81_017402 [Batrachochytrium salamandrivorans]